MYGYAKGTEVSEVILKKWVQKSFRILKYSMPFSNEHELSIQKYI